MYDNAIVGRVRFGLDRDSGTANRACFLSKEVLTDQLFCRQIDRYISLVTGFPCPRPQADCSICVKLTDTGRTTSAHYSRSQNNQSMPRQFYGVALAGIIDCPLIS